MLENIFEGLKAYAGKWEIDESRTRKLNSVELKGLAKAVVVSSDFGTSCEFHFTNGIRKYIPMDINCDAVVGDVLPLEEITILTLVKEGETPIKRITVNAI